MIHDLIERLELITALSPKFKQFLAQNLTAIPVAHNEFFLQPFQVSARLAFVGQGQMHAFRKINGQRITCRFYQPGDLCIDPTGYFSGKPSAVYIAPVLDRCIVYELCPVAQTVAAQFCEWLLLWEKLIAGLLLADEALLLMFRTMGARQRYEWVHQFYPGIKTSVRMRQFAAWIGLSPTTIYDIERQDRMSALRKRQKGS